MCKFSLRTYILPPSSLNILIISVLYSVSGRLLPFCLLLFVEFFPVISFGECCWSPPFGRVPVFFFYVWGRSEKSTSFVRVGLCGRCPVGYSGAVSLVIWARCFRALLCVGCLIFPVVALTTVYTSVGWNDSQADWLWKLVVTTVDVRAIVWAMTPQNGIHCSQDLVPADLTLWLCHLWKWLGGSLVLSEISYCVCVLGLLGRALVQPQINWCLCPS